MLDDATSPHPPTIDSVAAMRWHRAAPALSPWLHEEVARRMADRLSWIRLEPRTWAHWEAVRGGLVGHALVAARYPQARSLVVEDTAHRQLAAKQHLDAPWWQPRRYLEASAVQGLPASGSAQMLWSNMLLHLQAEPQALLAQWFDALAQDGFLMFSCLGPDTVRELHSLYHQLGWPVAAHAMTDMHDWGDMLVAAGFSAPVMDMERISLSYQTPERLVQELRELGRNLHPARFAGLRTPRWRQRLFDALEQHCRPDPGGPLVISFEIIYGHAIKPEPRVPVAAHSAVPLDTMRSMLRGARKSLQ